jgi:hypothetical protein
VSLCIGSCASTTKVKDPTGPQSTLLIGRIKLNCSNFPPKFNIDGENADGITVYFYHIPSEEFIEVRARGEDGVFHLINPAADQYIIAGFKYMRTSSNSRITLGQNTNPHTSAFEIRANAVNNLGDILWTETYIASSAKEHDQKGSHATLTSEQGYEYLGNCDELESWYHETYPDSGWNEKTWVDVSIK